MIRFTRKRGQSTWRKNGELHRSCSDDDKADIGNDSSYHAVDTSNVLGSVLIILSTLAYLAFRTFLCSRSYYTHFPDKETEVQKVKSFSC